MAILNADARQILLKAIAAQRAQGSHIAFDPNYRAQLWPNEEGARSAIAAALAVTDIALPTFPDEAQLHGDASPEATAKRLERAGVAEIIVKDGERPALISHYQKTETVPPIPLDAPLDTTGAGDAFNGAYLAARLLGIAPAEATKRAHRVAGAVVQVPGALAPFDLLRMAFDR